MTDKEKYNQIIDEVYKNYLNEWTFEKYPNDGSVYSVEPIKVKEHSKEQFVYRCKTDNEFSERWGLKIEEKVLSNVERQILLEQKGNVYRGVLVSKAKNYKSHKKIIESIKETCDEYNIPTKLITITYNNETIDSYE